MRVRPMVLKFRGFPGLKIETWGTQTGVGYHAGIGAFQVPKCEGPGAPKFCGWIMNPQTYGPGGE